MQDLIKRLMAEGLTEKQALKAIEIVKKFGAKDSYKFINGILDAIKKSKESGQ